MKQESIVTRIKDITFPPCDLLYFKREIGLITWILLYYLRLSKGKKRLFILRCYLEKVLLLYTEDKLSIERKVLTIARLLLIHAKKQSYS